MAAELSRRQMIAQLLSAGAALAAPAKAPVFAPVDSGFTPDEDKFLNDLEYANFQFFREQAGPLTGLVRDRVNVRKPAQTNILASIAATGFGLTAMCIGQKRGFITYADARDRVATALRSLANWQPNHRGFFFHWANIDTGERVLDSEVSSVDTAILLCGVLSCKAHFQDAEISRFATQIFDRVEWTWLSEDTPLLPHGWTPEFGFLPYHWDLYSELMMMYLLGLGSSSHPLPEETWNVWKRTTFEFDSIRYVGSFGPLFVHQYSQAWFDFRNKRDKYANYFENSALATDVHRRFCLDLAKTFPDYSNDLWGITASDSQMGYQVWGGPPLTGPIDGTVATAAAAGSLAFQPKMCLRVMKNIKDKYGAQAWCRYGFVNAFNPLKNWYDTDVIGIDTGITMLMAENARTGFVWETFMKNPEAVRGMERAGFKPA